MCRLIRHDTEGVNKQAKLYKWGERGTKVVLTMQQRGQAAIIESP